QSSDSERCPFPSSKAYSRLLKLRLRMYVHLEPIGFSPLLSLSQFRFIPPRNCSTRYESLTSRKRVTNGISQSGFDEKANSSSSANGLKDVLCKRPPILETIFASG